MTILMLLIVARIHLKYYVKLIASD